MTQQIVSRHIFRRLARSHERYLNGAFPESEFKVNQLTGGQRDRWGRRWCVVRTK